MSQVEVLLGEASKRSCEAIILSTMRQVHLLTEGSLRPFSNRPLSTGEIVDLLLEIAPQTVRSQLRGDCELTFSFRASAGATDVKVDKKAEFIFARIEVPKPAPAAASSPFDGLDLDLGKVVPEEPPKTKVVPRQPTGGAAKGSFPKAPGTENDLEIGTFMGKLPDLASLDDGPLDLVSSGAPALEGTGADEPGFGTGRDFELDADADAPLELDTEPRAAAPAFEARAPAAPAAPRHAPAPHPAPAERKPEPERPAIPHAAGLGTALPRLLQFLVAQGGSDLHLAPGSPPRIRIRGDLVPVGEMALTPADTEAMFSHVLDAEQRQRWEKDYALDFSLDLPGLGRFRANVYRQRKGLDLVFRAIARKIPTLEELGVPSAAEKLTTFPNGLILVTGPAGCGKSTTQAAIVDRINETWHDHVITVEDPIEFVHPVKNCLVNQREVGRHVRTFAEALRSALREDPDVILVGELRDLETIQLAITAAETGHLVLGTLHTIDSARTVDRLIDVFPGEQKLQMRSMVSESLRGVISQRLLPAAEGNGRVAAFELLLADRSIANLIREGKTFQIPNILKTSKAKGMVSMDDSLIALVQAKKILPQVALENMDRPEELTKILQGGAARKPAGPQGRPGAQAAANQARGAAAPGRKN